MHKRKGKFWSREYDDLIVDGADEFLIRCAYVAANPVAAGLVANPDMWGGVSAVPYLQRDSIVVGKGLNVSEYNDAKRHGRKIDKKKFEETFSFSLTTLPMLSDKTVNERVTYLAELISNAGQLARKKRGTKPSMGMKQVLAQSPFDRPKSPARGARFKIMSFCKARKKELYEDYRLFVSFYRGCCQSLIEYFNDAPNLKGMNLKTADITYAKYNKRAPAIIWPDGCYVPTTHKPMGA